MSEADTVRRTLILVAVVISAWLCGTTARSEVDLQSVRPVSAATCDTLVLQHPGDGEAYRCYRQVARRHRQWTEAVRRLEARLQVTPDDARATLALGSIEADRFSPRAESLLRSAAERFTESGDLDGQIEAAVELSSLLMREGRRDEARQIVDQAVALAEESDDPERFADASIQKARLARQEGDLVTARSLFEQVRERLKPLDEGFAHARVASGLAAIAWAEGRLNDALAGYGEAADICARFDDPFLEAEERYNMAISAGKLFGRGEVTREEVIRLANRAVKIAGQGGNAGAEAAARLLLAQDPAAGFDARIAQADLAVELIRRGGTPGDACFALRMLAHLVAQRDGKRGLQMALDYIDDALVCAKETASRSDEVRGRVLRAGLLAEGYPREEAVADLLAAVEAIEGMRDLQPDQLVRARFMWDWAFAYYRLAGMLLEPLNEPPAPEDADLAFRTIERLRARILLDALDSAGATETAMNAAPGVEAAREERDETLRSIAALQRHLLGPGLSGDELDARLDELDALEAREVELRVSIAGADPDLVLLRTPSIPGLAEIQAELAGDQAMLAFQLSTREKNDVKWYWNGGSWVFVITSDRWWVVPLPDRDVLEERISAYLGLLAARDPLEREAGARLFEDLLSEAVKPLDGTVRRWVIVPDGVLHRLPFGALRPSSGDDPLAASVVISEVPSATLWHHWKRSPAAGRPPAGLALADPELPSTGNGADAERAIPWLGDQSLDSLPFARSEARSSMRSLGSGSVLRVGSKASERFLKTAELDRFGILHVATHAVADTRDPQRSAVLLSPGADDEDGLLQLREVVTLELDGMVVILSGCSSASGEITEGEGVVGLARAFFQAGARAVVGSLWPLRDDEAAVVMTRAIGELGEGASVGEAVASTRRTALADGLPPAAWAGLVVLGDADHVPVPGGSRGEKSRWLVLVGIAFGICLLVGLSPLLLHRLRGR